MLNMYNGDQIHELRKSLGLTLEEFGEKLGVKRSTVCYWEKNKSHPRFAILEKINELAATVNGKNGHRKTVVAS